MNADELQATGSPGAEPSVLAGAGASGWDELLSTAMVGTDRRSGVDPGSLLDRFAREALRRRAGQRADRATPLPPAPEETRPLIGVHARTRLARMLGGDQSMRLPEWLEAAAERGLRVPAAMLPALLEIGARDRSIRAWIAVVAGNRGRWLAELRPKWAYLLASADASGSPPPAQAGTDRRDGSAVGGTDPGGTGAGGTEASGAGAGGASAGGTGVGRAGVGGTSGTEADSEVWELGGLGDRREYLRAVRGDDPGCGRELLAACWRKENAAIRAAFLEVFETGLGLDDEEFLQQALKDRAASVREVALRLILLVPCSSYEKNQITEAARYIRGEGGRLVARSLPPDLTWEKLFRRTPSRTWSGLLGGSAAEIVNQPVDPAGVRAELLAAWTVAAIAQRDVDWAEALLPLTNDTGLAVLLPPGKRQAYLATRVEDVGGGQRLLELLEDVPAPWTGELAAAVVRALLSGAPAAKNWYAERLRELAAARLDLAATGYRSEDLAYLGNHVVRTLRFRDDMMKELDDSTTRDDPAAACGAGARR